MDKIALTKTWLHFKNQAGLVFSCRRYEEEYPNLDKVLSLKGHPIVLPKGMIEASDRAAVFAADKAGDPLVNVSLSNGRIKVTGEGLSGWYKEMKKVNYEGPSLSFLISSDLLKHVSEKYQEATIGETKLKAVGGAWEYVTVLGRPKEEGETEDEEENEEEPKPAKTGFRKKKMKQQDAED